jgi:hypothetical protein
MWTSSSLSQQHTGKVNNTQDGPGFRASAPLVKFAETRLCAEKLRDSVDGSHHKPSEGKEMERDFKGDEKERK